VFLIPAPTIKTAIFTSHFSSVVMCSVGKIIIVKMRQQSTCLIMKTLTFGLYSMRSLNYLLMSIFIDKLIEFFDPRLNEFINRISP
jgi:hypothetical protein